MSRRPTPEQRAAADPSRSVWVTANAGTGKTRVLTDRFLRLLLDGADPESILAITFTKAAAAEMIRRIEERLAQWATLDEEELRADLENLLGRPPSERERRLARALLGRVLDLPRGLAIATIHSFCQSLLRRFPLEAGIPPHFEPIDERDAAELRREAAAAVLAEAAKDTGPLGRAVGDLAVWLADGSIEELVREILRSRTKLLRAREETGGFDGLLQAIANALRVDGGLHPRFWREKACADGEFDAARLKRAAEVLAASAGKRDGERAAKIEAWLRAVPADRARIFDEYCGAFLSKKGEPKEVMSKKLAARHPDLRAALVHEQGRLLQVADRERCQLLFAKTEAMLRLAFAVLDRYEELKAHRAALDFDDLIEYARRLLCDREQRAWVLYQLDARIDHVLVDEAQDTSPAQWAIVEALTEEFFAGEGARPGPRTLFVVGDEKQSIYRFQGADLQNFRAVRKRIAQRAARARAPIETRRLERSFRSVPAILDLVDRVFADEDLRKGVSEEPIRHESEREGEAGIVELWPLALHPPQEEEKPWELPDAPDRVRDPEQFVADAIARRIARWLREAERLPASNRPIEPRDVLVLVRRRGTIQERIVRALRRAGVPVAGADRLDLEEHLAVRDLLALGDVLVLPEDDMALACLLKSPLLGLGEEELFALARGRQVSLVERLRARAAEDDPRGPFATAYRRLEEWIRRADFMPPFELYNWILGADGGRERLLARLGPEAADPVEAFLGQALAYERGHPASLQGFLAWFRSGTEELQRDPEHAGDLVRVTTVHGAKGLEAPIVFLADAGPQGKPRSGRIVWGPDPDRSGPELPFWRASEDEREGFTNGLVRTEDELAEEEQRRLLYVALTRAAEWLIVTGWHNRRTSAAETEGRDPEGLERSWHGILARALERLPGLATIVDHDLGAAFSGPILRYATGTPRPLAPERAVRRVETSLPDWLRRPAPEEPRPPRPLSPSRVLPEPEPPQLSPKDAESERARRIGAMVHRLLELLPGVPEGERAAALDRFFARYASDLPPERAREIGERVSALLARPDLAPLFGPEARAEQAIVGVVDGTPISGRLDRLLVTAREVVAIDFKTDQRPPAAPERTPVGYLRQMALYRALLERRFPDRPVRLGLLWTASGELHWLDPELLDRHRPRLDGGEPGTLASA
ncbi:MAG: double-strand break repair helicase AddA [Geminicoccaceae bacterium]|nr:double-strand break repair helicase AddA [Geminicoccaceae bacterium]